MRKFAILTTFAVMLSGCIAVPVYDSGYYYPYYAPYHYFYAGPEVSIFVPGFHGGAGFHRGPVFEGGRGFHGGRR